MSPRSPRRDEARAAGRRRAARSRRLLAAASVLSSGAVGAVTAFRPSWAVPFGAALATAALIWDMLNR